VKEQIQEGRFVKFELEGVEDTLSDFTTRYRRATRMFRNGINLSLVISTIFLM